MSSLYRKRRASALTLPHLKVQLQIEKYIEKGKAASFMRSTKSHRVERVRCEGCKKMIPRSRIETCEMCHRSYCHISSCPDATIYTIMCLECNVKQCPACWSWNPMEIYARDALHTIGPVCATCSVAKRREICRKTIDNVRKVVIPRISDER